MTGTVCGWTLRNGSKVSELRSRDEGDWYSSLSKLPNSSGLPQCQSNPLQSQDLPPPPAPGSEGELVLLNRPLAYSASAQMSSPSSLLQQRTDGLGLSPRSVSIRAASLFTALAGARRTSQPCQSSPEGICGALFSAMLSLSAWHIQLARVDLQHQGETLSKNVSDVVCLADFSWRCLYLWSEGLVIDRSNLLV